MGIKRMPGLIKRGDIWHINKKVDGVRVCESTGSSQLKEAEKYLVRRLEAIRQAKVYGIRLKRSFREAATKFLLENQHKKSLADDVNNLKRLDAYIGALSLESIHSGSLDRYITTRRAEGVKNRTINYGLQLVRHILNLAAEEWRDEYGLTWLAGAPKIKLLPETDAREPYPLSWEEQEQLFAQLPRHLRDMALFAVNTGCRDQEVCRLRWSWQVNVLPLEMGFVFIIPKKYVKNGEDKLIILNQLARVVVEKQRGKHPEFVFIYRGKPLHHMLNNGWRAARRKVGLNVRVHDLRHTFGMRLRAAGVSFEDRQDLLGHKSDRMTTHYSRAQLTNLWEAANKLCDAQAMSKLTLLRTVTCQGRAKVAQTPFLSVVNGMSL